MLRHSCGTHRVFLHLLAVCLGLATQAVVAAERSPAYVVSISELAPAGTVVADLSSLIGSGEWTWEQVGFATDSPFQLDTTSGQVRLDGGAGIDFERRSQHLLTFRCVSRQPVDPAASLFADDLRHSGLAAAAVDAASPPPRLVRLRVRLVDEPEPPQWKASSPQQLTFDLGNPLVEHSVSATDADGDERLQYSILSGNDEELLACDPLTGRLSLQLHAAVGALRGARRRVLNLELGVTDSVGLLARHAVRAQVVDPAAWADSDFAPIDSATVTTPTDSLDLPIEAQVATEAEQNPAVALPAVPTVLESPSPPVVPSTITANSESATRETLRTVAVDASAARQSAANAGTPGLDGPVEPEPVPSHSVTEPLRVVPTSLSQSPTAGPRLRGLVTESSQLVRLVMNWGLLAMAGLGLSAAVSIALRGRRRRDPGSEAARQGDVAEASIDAPEVERRQGDRRQTPRTAGRSGPPTRSLRAEMADLLAVSQHFTVTQQAQQERTFHGKQFRLAAVVAFAAAAIALGQGMLGLDLSFASEGWVVCACVCIVTAAAAKALLSVWDAKRRMQTVGPLSAEIKLD